MEINIIYYNVKKSPGVLTIFLSDPKTARYDILAV